MHNSLNNKDPDTIFGAHVHVEGSDHVRIYNYGQCTPAPYKRNTGPSMEWNSATVAWLGNPR